MCCNDKAETFGLGIPIQSDVWHGRKAKPAETERYNGMLLEVFDSGAKLQENFVKP